MTSTDVHEHAAFLVEGGDRGQDVHREISFLASDGGVRSRRCGTDTTGRPRQLLAGPEIAAVMEIHEPALVAGGDEQHLGHGDFTFDMDVVERARRGARTRLWRRRLPASSSPRRAVVGRDAGLLATGVGRASRDAASVAALTRASEPACDRLGPHHGSPSSRPRLRRSALREDAGQAVGIGARALLVLARTSAPRRRRRTRSTSRGSPGCSTGPRSLGSRSIAAQKRAARLRRDRPLAVA